LTVRHRPAVPADVPRLAALLDAYMQETFARPWGGSEAALRADAFGAALEMIVAESGDGALVAFVAFQRVYDLHHCVSGAEIVDMFVEPARRARGVAVELLAAVAAESRRRGGMFVKGQAVESPSARRLYARVATCFPGADCYVGGRAFRALADLSGRGPRAIARGLPPKMWNHEP
jgi:GNAT superfamily N-acetyltransferase